MLAAEGAMPSGSAWAFEFAWDGLRAVAYLAPGRVRLLSASDRMITASYPELAALGALADRRGPLVLDGKIVALDRLGRPSTTPLRQRMSAPRPSAALMRQVPVQFYLLDVLYAGGRSTLEIPYRHRRELLAELDLAGIPAKLPPYFVDTDGQLVLHAARRHGLAGVVAKRLDSRYQPGRRSRAWVETLPRHTQRVLLGGWRPGAAGRSRALLIGVPDPTGTRYLGQVSIGPDDAARAELSDRLDELERPDCPFAEPPPPADARGVRWLTPTLVGEVTYRRREADGRLRNPSWRGLRPDVRPDSVRGPLVPPAAPGLEPAWSEVPAPPAGETRTRPPLETDVQRAAPPTAPDLTALDEAVRLAQAEVRALRAQISPHFMYNALTTIASYVRTDPPRARELLLEFAEYNRYSLRPAGRPSTLGAELANVDRYLALERARFDQRLRVVREVADELRDVELPLLTVQSLVECAVRHGIEGTPRGGTVTVRAVPSGADCVITVSEDATATRGAEPGWLAEAVADVRGRLSAAKGPAATLEASADAGTTVTLRLPLPRGTLNQ
jgi:histidine kinase/ATP dependent DNA ligase-like protein